MKRKTKKKLRKLSLSLVVLVILLIVSFFYQKGMVSLPELPVPSTPPTSPTPVDGTLQVHYIDVGQADSILLVCGEDTMLIDGGNRSDGDLVVDYISNLGIDQLDYVVGTHPHEDHMGGLDEVLNAFPTDNLWTPALNSEATSKAFIQDFLAAAQKQSLSPVQPELGETYPLGEAVITMLGPISYDYSNLNNLSLILMVEFGGTRFLFTGDAEVMAENDMLDYWGENYNFHADVLKVGHHGSKTSSGYRLLREVMPQYGIISVGTGNDHLHPNEEALSRLGDAEVLTYRTDYLGSVIAISNGSTISFTYTYDDKLPYIPE